jgi:hypothetical protein
MRKPGPPKFYPRPDRTRAASLPSATPGAVLVRPFLHVPPEVSRIARLRLRASKTRRDSKLLDPLRGGMGAAKLAHGFGNPAAFSTFRLFVTVAHGRCGSRPLER